MQEKEPMTPQGFEKISKELEYLKSVARGEIAKEIQVAAQLGDLKENAEYHAAKEKMNLLESRVSTLETLTYKAHVIDPATLEHKRVSFGSTVKLLDLDNEAELTYTIVGSVESDAAKGLISMASPLAKALIGKASGDEVTVNLPSGTKEFEVVEIVYKEIKFES